MRTEPSGFLLMFAFSGTKVSAEVDEVELEDGTKSRPFSVAFPEGNTVPAQNHKQVPVLSPESEAGTLENSRFSPCLWNRRPVLHR